jgi:3-isopropylmalate dehydrogenase
MEFRIAKLPGDGIGPEIVEQAVKVLGAIGEKYNHRFRYEFGLAGATAIEQTGNPYPDETHEICMRSDAVLFGAIGDPKYDNNPTSKVRPEQGLLEMRKKLQLFANIRPVRTFESLLGKSPLRTELVRGADFIVVRELTGGIYYGELRGRTEDGNKAFDTNVYSKSEIIRVTKLAFDYASKRRKKLTAIDKANVLATSRLWRETIQEMEKDYPGIEVEHMLVDNAAMQIIQWPTKFDVLITENMFGDILSDEASVITGSMGLLPSASIGVHTSVFEPIHGSYPQAAGKNIANPLATVLSAAMMLESLHLVKEAKIVQDAVDASLNKGMVTQDIAEGKAYSTIEVGDWLTEWILKN